MGYLTILLVICAIITFHEYGHFLFARLFGVGVERFSVGFGPILFAKKFGETEYALSAIPLGGYVKMVGELSDDQKPEDPRSYTSKPRWQRIIILLAGPVFNFIFGILLVLTVFIGFGIPTMTSRIVSVLKDSPAASAGVKDGDKILAINGTAVNSFQDVVTMLRSSPPGKEVELKVERTGSEVLNIKLTPVKVNDQSQIGIAGGEIVSEKDFKKSIPAGLIYSSSMVRMIASGLKEIAVGQTKLSDSLGGPITIVSEGEKIRSKNGWAGILLFAALLNFNLGLLNLLPIPILDGGNILILLVESVIRRPLSPRVCNAVQMFGLWLILGIMFFAISNDLSRLLGK